MTEDFSQILDLIKTINRWKDKNGHAHLVLEPVLAEDTLAEYEDLYGIRLPEEYRHFITKVGNGIKVKGLHISSYNEYTLLPFYPEHTKNKILPDLRSEFMLDDEDDDGNFLFVPEEELDELFFDPFSGWESIYFDRENKEQRDAIYFLRGFIFLSEYEGLVVNSQDQYAKIYSISGYDGMELEATSFIEWLTSKLNKLLERAKESITFTAFPDYNRLFQNESHHPESLIYRKLPSYTDKEISDHLSYRVLNYWKWFINRNYLSYRNYVSLYTFIGHFNTKDLQAFQLLKHEKLNDLKRIIKGLNITNGVIIHGSVSEFLYITLRSAHQNPNKDYIKSVRAVQQEWINRIANCILFEDASTTHIIILQHLVSSKAIELYNHDQNDNYPRILNRLATSYYICVYNKVIDRIHHLQNHEINYCYYLAKTIAENNTIESELRNKFFEIVTTLKEVKQ